MTEGYSEYLNPEYSFVDPIEFTLTRHLDGVDFITFPVFFRSFFVSMAQALQQWVAVLFLVAGMGFLHFGLRQVIISYI